MKDLFIDLETYSSVPLNVSGIYPYAESEDFEILLFGYSVDGGPVNVVDMCNGEIPPREVLDALTSPEVTKWAFNASFERVCLSSWLRRCCVGHFRSYGERNDAVGNFLDPSSWRCTMAWSAYCGLPLSLAGVGKILDLEDQKLTEGKDLIRYFCQPCRPTKSNGGRTRNLPRHAPEKWQLFKSYNCRDVEVELAIHERLRNNPVPEQVWREYHLDQEINDRGILLDLAMVDNAIALDARSKAELLAEMRTLTPVENPNSVSQLKEWLGRCGLVTDTLGRGVVADLIKDAPEDIRRILELRLRLSRSSVKKYQAMKNCVCADGRARGCFQFYGANRTGRWAGRHIQLQNLPQNHLPDLADARELVRKNDYAALALLYEDIPDTLSQLIRTAFIPGPGYKFIVADFAAIEARVLSFLAGESWRNDVFASNGDIYCASASAMFGVPVEKHGVNAHLRQKGKIAELALGYGGSIGALRAMGALQMGLHEEELYPLVSNWRYTNPNIVSFWSDVENAAIRAVTKETSTGTHGLTFIYKRKMLFILLPSGRRLSYVKAKVTSNRFGFPSLTYEGTGVGRKWERQETFGGRLVENIVQAVSRDILAHAMLSLKDCRIVAHVHDEVIMSAPMEMTVDSVCEIMGRTPPWIKGLALRADGYETPFYRKD